MTQPFNLDPSSVPPPDFNSVEYIRRFTASAALHKLLIPILELDTQAFTIGLDARSALEQHGMYPRSDPDLSNLTPENIAKVRTAIQLIDSLLPTIETAA